MNETKCAQIKYIKKEKVKLEYLFMNVTFANEQTILKLKLNYKWRGTRRQPQSSKKYRENKINKNVWWREEENAKKRVKYVASRIFWMGGMQCVVCSSSTLTEFWSSIYDTYEYRYTPLNSSMVYNIPN